MKLSILDQAPLTIGTNAQDALYQSLKLAQLAEKSGYTRYWIAEHHGMTQLASSVPEVMLGFIGGKTSTIKIGAGAVLLPHYKPYKVAETYNLLATLFPGRVDIGIGRAPGGSAEASIALSGNFLENVKIMPEKIKELFHFIYNDFPDRHPFDNVVATPVPAITPDPWILGTSKKSAELAAAHGTSYAFGQFMSDNDGVDIIQTYREAFVKKRENDKPYVLVTVSVICAETSEKANEIAQLTNYWKEEEAKGNHISKLPKMNKLQKSHVNIDENKSKLIVGSPSEVKQHLIDLQQLYNADEIMIVTNTYNDENRHNSYQLIAEEVL